MSERNEAERLDYVLGSPVFDWAGPEVVRFEAHEALSKLFHVDITLRSMGGPIAADELISSPATLRIRTAEGYRSVHGLIAEVDELDRTALASFVRVRLVPAWYRATQRVRSRTFVDQTLGEIIVHVLENRSSESPQGDAGLQAGATLEGELEWESYETPAEGYRFDVADRSRLDDPVLRAYTVQFVESDHDFLSRLLAEEGLSTYVEHDVKGSRLVITDRPLITPEREVRWNTLHDGAGSRERDIVTSLKFKAKWAWGNVGVSDFDPARPQRPRRGFAIDEANAPHTIYHERLYPSRDEAVGSPCVTPAKIVLERRVALRALGTGTGTDRNFHVGEALRVVDDATLRDDAWIYLVSVTTFATQFLPEGIEDPTFGLAGRGHRSPTYENRFEFLSQEIVFRPALDGPRPRIDGIQQAIVTAEEAGDPPPEIHRNDRGDVRVRFPWDERQDKGTPSSTWVRVSNGWAGTSYGQLFTPRVGQEVLIAYLNGDPDRPLIVGRVHNAIEPVEYAKPTISTIKTKSSPKSDGFNELRFDDEAAKEEIFIHAQRDLNETVLANHSTSVGGDQSNSVGGNQSNSVSGKRDHKVTGPETVIISGLEDVTCETGRCTAVGTLEELFVDGYRTVETTGLNRETYGGPYSVTSPTASHTHSANFHVVVGGSEILMTPASIILKTPGASISMVGGFITIASAAFSVATGICSVNAKGGCSVTTGGTLSLSGSEISGEAGSIKWNG